MVTAAMKLKDAYSLEEINFNIQNKRLPWWFRIRVCAPNAGGLGSIPGWGTKIPHTVDKPMPCN